MITRLFLLLILSLSSILAYSQEETLLSALSIPVELSKDANAVVRWDDNYLEVRASNKMVYTNKRIVTILNSSGDSRHGAVMHYDKHTNIKKIEAKIYDAFGKEIKKIRKNEFEDVSAVSGGTLFSDSRVKYLNYTPTGYPYTILFEIEVEYSSTGFLPGWRPIEGYFISTENAHYKIVNLTAIPIMSKISNFEEYGIEKISDHEYSASQLTSIKPESYSPDFTSFTPLLKATLTEFEMEGVKGVNTNWNDFGKWMSDALINGTEVLPQQAKQDIKTLTASAKTDLEKAKIVYQYVQDKTRYISVQVGIGGWKPMLASDVDRLGYGDCKGLTNYTKALMDEVGVESYYAVIYGDRGIRNIDSSFSSIQGNHVVLCVPSESDYIWLECTSQTTPFGYNANFTDDRDALIITPEGGQIVHTTVYKTEENLLDTKASVFLSDNGDISATISSKSSGTQFSFHEGIQNQSLKDQKLHYKDFWSYINMLEVESMEFNNDKDNIVFTEKIGVKAERYASKTGDRILLQPNLFNRWASAPQRYQERKIPFEMERGFTDIDYYEITIPELMEVEALMEDIHIKTQFGEYEASVKLEENNKLSYKRKLILKKGSYQKEDYEDFREFMLTVVKSDQAKIVLKTKS